MKPVGTFTVIRTLPEQLFPLRDIAANLWWSWNPDAAALFARLHPDLWELTRHNPIQVLDRVDSTLLARAAEDAEFLAHMHGVHDSLSDYMAEPQPWFAGAAGGERPVIAYFSAEFAVTESLPIFSGGLGVLAGDHLKSASDLGIPLVGVGLLYRRGYFEQRIDAAGYQREEYVARRFEDLPITLERRTDGSPVTISVAFPGRRVIAQVWRAQVGRVPLYLLDTDVPSNWAEDREITAQLYGGDVETRIRQEIVLGIGGYRALEAVGVAPTVYHMNEGHAAFVGLERIRRLMEDHGVAYEEARAAASSSLVFTTHTPVEAGHDYFPPVLMDRYLRHYAEGMGLGFSDLLGLGRREGAAEDDAFCMTVLALRMAAQANGVSELHGAVSRHMWKALWPGLPVREVPIGYVTNGVHMPSWVAPQLAAAAPGVFEAASGGSIDATRSALSAVSDEAIQQTHLERKRELIAHIRGCMRQQRRRRGGSPAEVQAAGAVLDENALTIGFARRFATYKRATLLLRHPERLRRLVGSSDRPVQFVFAGKAHPKDELGKALIREIHELCREEPFASRFVFIEGYDPAIARLMVQGVDVWMNNPRRPLEASGTSGMKAAANGVLNLSVLDGWWAEAWDAAGTEKLVGWAIGTTEDYDDAEEQDRQDWESLFAHLERDVVPLYYGESPAGWVKRMRESIAQLAPVFNTDRMVREYTERFYLPTHRRGTALAACGLAGARDLAAWRQRVEGSWQNVGFETVEAEMPEDVTGGGTIRVRAWIVAPGFEADELSVELFVGPVDENGHITGVPPLPMQRVAENGDSTLAYEAEASAQPHDGLQGYTVRVRPVHAAAPPQLPGLVRWAEPTPSRAEAAD